MKKMVVVCAFLFAAILGSTRVEAKGSQKGFYSGNTYQKGQFRFTYMVEKKGGMDHEDHAAFRQRHFYVEDSLPIKREQGCKTWRCRRWGNA